MANSTKQLGLKIKELRESRNWSQRECATHLGLHHTYVAHIELGQKNMTVSTLEKIASGFGITLEELFKGL